MGGAYSVGQDNDDLIDKLKEKDYIRTVEVERVFRMVDRAHYYLEENRKTAYEDIAWRNGLLHMSAPCIYSKVMEALELQRGMSFLNLGSGTGYLNTLAGYAMGPYGINHGIELHADNVSYAEQRLEEFIQSAPRFDDLELCEPKFVVGNCLNLSVENRLYDRVYCGAACPPEQQEILQNMVKIGGILITPVGDQLLKIKRVTATEFSSENILPVSFASLILPTTRETPDEAVIMPEVNPLSLQSISRIAIRHAIRSTFEFNLPVARASRSRRKGRREESSSSSLYRGLASFNFVPTRDGIMVMGFGGHGDRSWSRHIVPMSQRSTGIGDAAAAASDSDDSTADENIEDEDEEEEEGDDDDDSNLLGRQLRIHAQALRRIRERSGLDDVDSDMSDSEDSPEMSLTLPKDVNGNSTKDARLASSSSNSDEHSGIVLEGEEVPKKSNLTKTQHGKRSVPTSRKKKTIALLCPEAEKGQKSEQSDKDGKESKRRKEPHSSSLSFDEDAILSEDESQDLQRETANGINSSKGPSTVIDVPATGNFTQPCTIQKQVSYSTSADTSETSGFGSLGDDAALLSESFKEGPASLGSDVFQALPSEPGSSNWHDSPPLSSNKQSMDEGIETHADVDWMDVEEERATSEDASAADDEDAVRPYGATPDDEERPDLSRYLSEEGMHHENSSENFDSDNDINMRHMLAQFPRLVKRGTGSTSSENSDNDKETDDESGEEEAEEDEGEKAPLFSTFLKEKVDTLPIPNSIKAFILHYR